MRSSKNNKKKIEKIKKKIKLNQEELDYKKKHAYYQKNYGVSYAEFLEKAKNGCVSCGKKHERLCLDHIHVKGYKKMEPEEKKKYVRSTLCFLCNVACRVFERSADGAKNRAMLEGIYKYFQQYPLKGEI